MSVDWPSFINFPLWGGGGGRSSFSFQRKKTIENIITCYDLIEWAWLIVLHKTIWLWENFRQLCWLSSTRHKRRGELCSYQIFANQATWLILQPDLETVVGKYAENNEHRDFYVETLCPNQGKNHDLPPVEFCLPPVGLFH